MAPPNLDYPRNLENFSKTIFGLSYTELSRLIYPRPVYGYFYIRKKDGGNRLIEAPSKAIKSIQYSFLKWLNDNIPMAPQAPVHGFVKGKSVYTNAKFHFDNKPYAIIHFDIKDFFQSISFYRVRGLFLKSPFNFPYEIATVCAHVCCYEKHLPQGAPTSPFISNMICYRLDRQLNYFAKKLNVAYSRYADDLTFSMQKTVFQRHSFNFIKNQGEDITAAIGIRQIIENNSFSLNDSKTYLKKRPGRLLVNNIKINQKLNLNRLYIDEIRGILHSIKKYDWKSANEQFLRKVDKSVTERSCYGDLAERHLENYLRGKILYLKMIKGDLDPVVRRFVKSFNSLQPCSPIPFDWRVTSFEEAKTAVFVVEVTGDCCDKENKSCCITEQGTAFAFLDQKLFLTCNHVLEDGTAHASSPSFSGSINITNPEDPSVTYDCECVFFDRNRDYAVLKVKDNIPEHHIFTSATTNHFPANGYSLGFPDWHIGRKLELRETKILSANTLSGRRYLSTSGNIGAGQSGGALVNDNFEAVGIMLEGAIFEKNNNISLNIEEVISNYKPTLKS